MVAVFGIFCENFELSDKEKKLLLNSIPASTRVKLNKLKNNTDYIRSLLGEVLARFVIAERTGLETENIHFDYNDKGKPYLKNNGDHHFNISHSGNWVVVALSNEAVGIDIEKIREPEFRIADRYFSSQEQSDLKRMKGNDKSKYFFDLWTLKESFLKLLGKGLTRSLGSFTLIWKENRFHLLEAEEIDGEIYFKQYEIDPSYRLSVCSVSDSFNHTIEQFTMNDLMNRLR